MPVPAPAIDDLGFFQQKTKLNRRVKPMFLSSLTLRNAITNIADNGSGAIRITTDGAHNLSTNDYVIIDGANGTMAMNGFWKVTSVTSSTFDLQGSSSTGTWTSGGTVNDGESYAIDMDSAPSSVLVIADVKDMSAGGAINDAKPIALKVTVNSAVEIARSVATYKRMFQSLTIQNNDASTMSGDIVLRTTKAQGNIVEKLIPFALLTEYKLVVGIDGLQWMFKETGLPYVS